MNLRQLIVGVVTVTTLVLTGCTGNAAPTPPAPTQSQVPTLPSGDEDLWETVTTTDDIPAMKKLGPMLGLEDIRTPISGLIDQGYVGVGQLRTKCLALLSTDGITDSGNMTTVVIDRYQAPDIEIAAGLRRDDIPITEVRQSLDEDALDLSC